MSKTTKTNWEQVAKLVQATPVATLKKAISGIDGWTIYDPSKFTDAGLDPAIVAAFHVVHKSGMGKEGISTDAGPVDELKGVYGLSLLEFIARQFEVSSCKLGRGSTANDLTEQLLAKWK